MGNRRHFLEQLVLFFRKMIQLVKVHVKQLGQCWMLVRVGARKQFPKKTGIAGGLSVEYGYARQASGLPQHRIVILGIGQIVMKSKPKRNRCTRRPARGGNPGWVQIPLFGLPANELDRSG